MNKGKKQTQIYSYNGVAYYKQNNKKQRQQSMNNRRIFINTLANKAQPKDMIEILLNSQKGFYNAGNSCYMASIIQILIHLDKFVNEFFKQRNNYPNTLSYILFNFLQIIVNSQNDAIKINYFSENFNKINSKFSGKKGNNPMTFFNEFIKKLGKENNGKLEDLFTGKKKIKFEGISDGDHEEYEENFIFYLINLDEKNKYIIDALYQEKEFEDDKNIKSIEKIKVILDIFIC